MDLGFAEYERQFVDSELDCESVRRFMSTKTSVRERAATLFVKAVGPHRYGVHGKPFVCWLCGHDRFRLGSDISLLGLYSLACDECSHVELFAWPPPVLADDAA